MVRADLVAASLFQTEESIRDTVTAPKGRMVSDGVLRLLADAVVEADTILPMPEVDRATYAEFATVIERLRGKWKRGKGHVFPYDPRSAIAAVLATGVMPDANPHAYFPTPAELAAEIVEDVDLEWWPRHSDGRERGQVRILEPSAGWGALADAARLQWPGCNITTVEIDLLNASALRAKGYSVVEADFLTWRCDRYFDVIVGNPPFTIGADTTAWIQHFHHAWSMLAPGGAIGWVAPCGTWQSSPRKVFASFREWMLDAGARTIKHPDESFKSSGTTIQTMHLVVAKHDADHPDPSQNGARSHWSEDAEMVAFYADNDRGMYERRKTMPLAEYVEMAIVFANSEHGGGLARTQALRDQLTRHWGMPDE